MTQSTLNSKGTGKPFSAPGQETAWGLCPLHLLPVWLSDLTHCTEQGTWKSLSCVLKSPFSTPFFLLPWDLPTSEFRCSCSHPHMCTKASAFAKPPKSISKSKMLQGSTRFLLPANCSLSCDTCPSPSPTDSLRKPPPTPPIN